MQKVISHIKLLRFIYYSSPDTCESVGCIILKTDIFMKKHILLIIILGMAFSAMAQNIDLSKQEWHLWLDEKAEYFNDKLYLPPYNLNEIQSCSPMCGWDSLYNQKDAIPIKIPATVEEYTWGENGDSHGICGNYCGVSWFTTDLKIPASWKGKRIVLDFESVRMRAEVYLNNRLAGYEIINGTPFSVDISKYIKYDSINKLAVRITDPNGNFAWRDWDSFMWGDYEIPPSHGFGGITGKVYLNVTDKSYIDNIYIQNTPEINRINVITTIENNTATYKGNIEYTISEYNTGKIIWKDNNNIVSSQKTFTANKKIKVNNIKSWSLESPNLYLLTVKWQNNNGESHSKTERFGFRWFDVKTINGDKMFMLNNKRIVLHTAISWGHWPVNGIYPTEELAQKHIMSAKQLGMNMLNFHRGIGQTSIMDLADELGILIYEEPGGYRPGKSDFAKKWKREKLLRMVKRDRNHPSLVITNMINESARDPFPNEINDIRNAHKIDPTRCITFTSTFFGPKLYNGMCPVTPTPIKMHMLPNDTTIYYQGWWDKHHADGPGVYKDEFYKSKEDFLRYKKEKDEIIFYGEEGAIGTPPRLQLIKNEIEKSGEKGWNGDDMLKQYKAFDSFIKDKGFTEAFPDVDSLCRSLGSVSYYYQGKMIENVYISNNIDGWATNGWESTKVENHSGIVDLYRNHKTCPSIIAYYNQPLYIAVKAKNKVVKTNDTTSVDFYIVNKSNLKGRYKLTVFINNDTDNTIRQKREFYVNISGGVIYGELLKENIDFTVNNEGYSTVRAELSKNGKVVATGNDVIFSVKDNNVSKKIFVADTSRSMCRLLDKANVGYTETSLKDVLPENGTILLGKNLQPGIIKGNFRQDDPLIEWVSRGGKLIILDNASEWCTYLEQKEIADYRGSRKLGQNWFGGNFFVKHHKLFNGLPQATAFNWEYQCFAAYDRHREGLRLENGECIVGCYADHKNELFSALSIIPVGKGYIIISTLDFNKGTDNPVGMRLLKNILNY